MKIKKEKISDKLGNLIKDYSEDKYSLEEALDKFEALMTEYSNLRGEDNNRNIIVFKKSLQSFKEKVELIHQLKKEYEKNYAENIMLKRKLGIMD